MEVIGKLGSDDTTRIVMLTSASKDVSIKCSDQCLKILNNKEILNGLKGSTKMQKKQSKVQISTKYIQCSKEL